MGYGYSKNNVGEQDLSTAIQAKEKELSQLKACVSQLQNQLSVVKKLNNANEKQWVQMIEQTYNSREYDSFVLSGGGMKAIAFTGALEQIDEFNILYTDQTKKELRIKNLCGVSAGSIIVALLAIGYTPVELIDTLKTIDFEKIFDDNTSYLREGLNMIEIWGLCKGQYILDLLGNLINAKVNDPDYTIEKLYSDKRIKLVIPTTCMTDKKTVYLYPGNPIKQYSNIPIRIAVRMSMGIPFLFQPFEYCGRIFSDGGVLDNYPLHVFDGAYPGDLEARLNLLAPNPKVLGLKLMTVDDQYNYELSEPQKFKGFFDYSFSYITTFLTENDRRVMTPEFWLRSSIIITPDYPLGTKSLTMDQKEELIELGKSYVKNFFLKL